MLVVVVVVVVVVDFTLTRIFTSVATGQAPVILEWKNTQGKTRSKPKMVHAHITAEAIHASAKKNEQIKPEVSLRQITLREAELAR